MADLDVYKRQIWCRCNDCNSFFAFHDLSTHGLPVFVAGNKCGIRSLHGDQHCIITVSYTHLDVYKRQINYLLFEHDEKTGKKIVDESGRSILRKEFYMYGLNLSLIHI